MKFMILTKACPRTLSVCLALFAASVSPSLFGETHEWPNWRGEDRSGRSPETGLLREWPEGGPERVWLYRDAGLGYSGPAIVDGVLYTQGARDKKTTLIALDARTGKERWTKAFDEELENGWGNGPRCTPMVDGEHLYALSGRGRLICVKASDGAQTWSIHLVDDFGGDVPNWGYTESVLIDGDRLICTPGGEQGSVLALNKKTGAKLWQSNDLTVGAQYASPIVVEHAGVRQYIQLFQKDFAGFEAETGKMLWQSDFPKGRTAVIPTPIYHEGIVYVTAGYSAGCKAIRLGPNHEVETLYEKGEISNHHGG